MDDLTFFQIIIQAANVTFIYIFFKLYVWPEVIRK